MNRKFLAITSSICMLANTFSICSIPVSAEDSVNDVKIMSLGDSITDGYWTTGGYRKYMYHELELMGYTNIDMVGAKGNNSSSFEYNGETVSYDDNYSGYSGYAIQKMTEKEYREGILETIQGTWFDDGKNMIQSYNPDIVLLQIGTNDILSGYNEGITERLENLANVILSYMTDPTDILYVSTIPDIDAIMRADWLGAYGINAWSSTDEEKQQLKITVQECIDSYNKSIYNMVSEMQKEGKQIKFADINSVIDYQTDLYDGVHPNEQGYEKMGKYWADIIDSELNGNTPPVSETTTMTTTSTSSETSTVTETTTSAITTTETTEISSETTTEITEITETTEKPVIPVKNYTIADAVRLSKYILCEYELTPEDDFDINSDGYINSYDLIDIKRIISRH